jgi:hypothetical protein
MPAAITREIMGYPRCDISACTRSCVARASQRPELAQSRGTPAIPSSIARIRGVVNARMPRGYEESMQYGRIAGSFRGRG